MSKVPHVVLGRVTKSRLARTSALLGLSVYRNYTTDGKIDPGNAVTITIGRKRLAELGNPKWLVVAPVPDPDAPITSVDVAPEPETPQTIDPTPVLDPASRAGDA